MGPTAVKEKNRIPVSKIVFGKTDAYNELQEYGPEHFLNAFLQYDAYKIDEFLKGSRYYICGNKGAGKTALLKYLECTFSENPENLIVPIRYATDFDTEDRKELVRTVSPANISEAVIEDLGDLDGKEQVLSWQVYFIKQIVESMEKGEYHIFKKDRAYENLRRLLRLVYSDAQGRITPKVSRGKITVNMNLFQALAGELNLEAESHGQLSYRKVSKKILELFFTLNYQKAEIWILVDELELSVRNKKENERDICLVRDMILAIGKFNDRCRKAGFGVRAIAAVRSEVISSVLSSGFELNKLIEDYGKEVSWYQRGGNYRSSPIIKLIEQKIMASELREGITEPQSVWTTYFPRYINGVECRKYLLSYTWHRPRDIIRLLGLIQDFAGNEERFTQEMFDRALREYSERSWNEIVEELRLTYSADDVDAIYKMFNNIQVPFTYASLGKRLDELSDIYENVAKFRRDHKLIDVLERLFDRGVLGNSGSRMLFKFLNDAQLAPTENMVIHLPLRNYFAVKSQAKDVEDYYAPEEDDDL